MQAVKKLLKTSSLFLLCMFCKDGLHAQSSSDYKLISPMDLHLNFEIQDSNRLVKSTIEILPFVFQASTLPLFCKFEHLLGKNSKYNIKMRLGDVDYVNKLEGKGILHQAER